MLSCCRSFEASAPFWQNKSEGLFEAGIIVPALARHSKLTILTKDWDFEALPDIRTADWSKP
jgi:hypothetical protein